MEFITGLAWVAAIICWPIGLLALYLELTETELQRALQDFQGVKAVYYWGRYLIAAIIATVWLVTM